jgi:hypothetical protein
MPISLQTSGDQFAWPAGTVAATAQPPPDKIEASLHSGEARTESAIEDSATHLTLSTTAKAQAGTEPSRSRRYDIIWNYEDELAKNPTEAITKLRTAFIELDKAYLAKLDSDDKPIDLRTGKPISDPAIIAKLKESTLRALKNNEEVLQEHLTIAAGGNPAAEKAKLQAAVAAVEAASTPDPDEPSSGAPPPKPPAAAKSKANPIDAAAANAALLIELLAKGNEAYRAAAKRPA